MKLWRINLKPNSTGGIDDATGFCVERDVVGVGWPVQTNPATKEEYFALARQRYGGKGKRGWSAAVRAVLHRMAPGDLVWTRDRRSVYYLGKIAGEWQPVRDEEFVRAGLARRLPPPAPDPPQQAHLAEVMNNATALPWAAHALTSQGATLLVIARCGGSRPVALRCPYGTRSSAPDEREHHLPRL